MTITVFLVDDHTIIRDGLRAILNNESDMEVIGEAGNGRDAVHCIVDLYPDVVVMDIVMPELNGIDAACQILKACPSTKVIFLSMHISTRYVCQALQIGACGYVPKGASGREVIQAIRAAQEGRQYLSPRISDGLLEDYVQRRGRLDSSPLEPLTPRQREVVQLVAEGKSSVEIARILSLSPTTIDTYRSRAMGRLGISSIVELTKFAIRQGLTPLE